jgi:DNA-directed RNA polymerase specialized sigma24 family protein
MSMPEPNVTALLARAVAGETNAWNEIFSHYQDRLRAIVRRLGDPGGVHGAEDVAQAVMKTVFRRINEGKYEVMDSRDNLEAFIWVIARAKVALAWRHIYRDGRVLGQEAFGEAGIEQAVADKLVQTAEVEIRDMVEQLSRHLPHPRMRQPLTGGPVSGPVAGIGTTSVRHSNSIR